MSLWPLLQEMGTLYCRPERRGEIKSAHWPVQWNLWWKRCSNASIKSCLIMCPSLLRVCMHVCQPCVCTYVYVRRCSYALPCALVAVCGNPNLFTAQKSWYGPFAFQNEKQIQMQGQFPSLIICCHFQIKINFRSPCCSPLGLKYFPFECVWWKVFSAQPPRAGVLRGKAAVHACVCMHVCMCVCVCMLLEHIANLRWKRAVNADLSCPALLCLFRTESECFILKTDNITPVNTHTHTHTLAQKRFSVVVHVCLWCVLSEALFVLLPMLDQVGWNLLLPADGCDTVAEGGYWSVSAPHRQHLRDSG